VRSGRHPLSGTRLGPDELLARLVPGWTLTDVPFVRAARTAGQRYCLLRSAGLWSGKQGRKPNPLGQIHVGAYTPLLTRNRIMQETARQRVGIFADTRARRV
jgi:hypothetical protein